MSIDRRRFLQASGAAAVAGAAGLPAGCGDNLEDPGLAGLPATGAVFDVETDRALIWVGGLAGAEVVVTVADTAGTPVAAMTTELGEAGTGVVEIRGLAPGTPYFARLDNGSGRGGLFRFVTAPSTDDTRAVRLVWSADIDLDPQFATGIFDRVRDLAPDVLISLGDWPYADNPPGALTLAEYRERHRLARDDLATQHLLRAMSVRAIYDDHEVRNNWDASTAITEPDRLAAALTAWDEYFPVRGAMSGTRFRRWRWGAHVDCFLLDCRRHRSANAAPDDAAKTMLGEAQLTWLLDGVRTSTARWKLIFTSVPLDFGHAGDHWSSFTAERLRLYAGLVATPGVLFLTGDQHWFASHRHAHGFRELQAGPIARGLPVPPDPVPGVLARVVDYNVGVLDIDAAGIRARCVDSTGAIRHDELLTIADLTPTPAP